MKEITTDDVRAANPDDVQIIDVRESEELSAGMIAGASHLPMSELGARFEELDRARPIIAVCRSGARSASVAAALTEAGYDCDTMGGGMVEWAARGLPVERG